MATTEEPDDVDEQFQSARPDLMDSEKAAAVEAAQQKQEKPANGNDGNGRAEEEEGEEATLQLVKSTETEAEDHSTKASSSDSFWLRLVFSRLGSLIARCPGLFLAIGLVSSLLFSVGMFKIELKDRIRDGYTPDNAPSHEETRAMRQFWNSTDEPLMTVILVESSSGERGGMLRLAHLEEAVRLQQFLTDQFNCSVDGRQFKFSEICGHQCMAIKFPLEKYVLHLGKAIKRLAQGKTTAEQALGTDRLDYPQSTVHYIPDELLLMAQFVPIPLIQPIPVKIHLERMFFGVKLRNNRTDSGDDEEQFKLSPEQRLTNMAGMELLLLLFRADEPSSLETNQKLARWQLAVADHIYEQFKSDRLRVHVVGTEILNREMMREGRRTIPFFASGFCVMLVFVFANVLLTAKCRQHRIGWSRVWISGCIVLCPVLAITGTYGLLALLGQRFNSFLLILPYLVLGIGVDDGFLLIHNWDGTRQIREPSARLAFTLAEVGPSITITTLTNVASFAVGAFMPTPEVRIFCRGASIALSLVYLLQLLLFCPLLFWIGTFERRRTEEKDGTRLEGNGGLDWHDGKDNAGIGTEEKPTPIARLFSAYCWLLSRWEFAIVLLLLLPFYWLTSIDGALSIRSSLNTTKIIPRNSPLQDGVKLLDELVWNDYFVVTLLVRSPFGDLSDEKQLGAFWQAIDEFERQPNSKGKEYSLVWLRDYQKFVTDQHQLDMNSCQLAKFLAERQFQHWHAFVRLGPPSSAGGCPSIEQFSALLAYNETGSWDQRVELVLRLREIATRRSNDTKRLDLVVWEQNGMFIDQIRSLKRTALETGFLTLGCMAVICVFFTPNPFSVFISLLAISSICIGVFGQLFWWGFDLDPIVMAAFLMSIGLSIDFCAHIVYHFQFEHVEQYNPKRGVYTRVPLPNRLARIKFVLGTVAWPMLQSGLSTILCICPLLAIQSYAGNVFIVTIFLVCSLGLVHGLLILPCLLSMLPNFCTTSRIFNGLLGGLRSVMGPKNDG